MGARAHFGLGAFGMSRKKKRVRYRAAGGVVLDAAGRVLLIERDVPRAGTTVHEVRLPKGHVDPGETDVEAAMREVGEETGYWELRVRADLDTLEHGFEFDGRTVEREEHYFLMDLASDENRGPEVAPGSEEALFEVLWAPSLAVAADWLTFETEREFVRRAIRSLADG